VFRTDGLRWSLIYIIILDYVNVKKLNSISLLKRLKITMSLHTIRMMASHHSSSYRVKFPRKENEIATVIHPKKSLSEEFSEAEEHGRRMAQRDINYDKLTKKWQERDVYESFNDDDSSNDGISNVPFGCSIQ
jgi:hypothetical protein